MRGFRLDLLIHEVFIDLEVYRQLKTQSILFTILV